MAATPRLTGSHHAKGVSIIEMMIVIAIVAIIAGLALPSFTNYLSGTRVRGVAESVQNGLQIARQEAVRRNAEVRFEIAAADQADLWRVFVVGTGAVVQRKSRAEGSGSGLVISTNMPAITFNGLGRVTTAGAPDPIRINVCDTAACANGATRVEVTLAGGVRMCNPGASGAKTSMTCT